MRDGIAGLQSVVLYSLPELDGAIDTVPIGGLVNNDIYLVPERVARLASRIKRWTDLRRKPTKVVCVYGAAWGFTTTSLLQCAAQDKKLAIILYGFPPGVGATGTAALLNVPKSLEGLLRALEAKGYDVGDTSALKGEDLVSGLVAQQDGRAVARGVGGVLATKACPAGVLPVAHEVPGKTLRDMLAFPSHWGPNEWGPLPFLPSANVLVCQLLWSKTHMHIQHILSVIQVQRVERAWGSLLSYRGLNTTAKGASLVNGLQLGNVFIGVQPALGVQGDPMRLLFERDLTPHPQYAAFYKWLQVFGWLPYGLRA